MRVLVHINKRAWTKLVFKREDGLWVVKGFEVYSSRPSASYWRVNYGHGEPKPVLLTESVAFRLSKGFGQKKFLLVWVGMNTDPHVAGVEVSSTLSFNSRLASIPELVALISHARK